MKIIGLTGTNCAGKGEAAEFLKKKGFAYFSLSDLIRDKLQKQDMELTRNNLIRYGNLMRKEGGPDILARLVMRKVKGPAIIDSIRNPKEVEYLQKQKDFILLAIDAPIETRYIRAKKRGRDESASSLQEFKDKEAEEMTSKEKNQQLQNCIKMADHIIINAGSLADFHSKLEKLL
jgi:dephospho-CoA kinase